MLYRRDCPLASLKPSDAEPHKDQPPLVHSEGQPQMRRCHQAASTRDLLLMSVTLVFCLIQFCLTKCMLLRWLVTATSGLDRSGVADGH